MDEVTELRKELELLREAHKDEIDQLRGEVDGLKREIASLHSYVSDLPPVSFAVERYDTLRRSGGSHASRPFLTHPRGYKMCIKVFPGGVLDGKDSHLSVACHIIRSEHDLELKWPFCGNVYVRLVNQRDDGRGHCDHFVRYTQRTPRHISGPVVAPVRRRSVVDGTSTTESTGIQTSQGNYLTQFITYSQLTNNVSGTQYLLNDSLHFIVTKVEVR